MRPIRATPSSDEPSDQTGGTLARTAQRSYGNAPPRCESSRPPAGLSLVWALATESRPAAPVPGLGHCRRPHRPERAASGGGRGTERKPLPQRLDHQGVQHVLCLTAIVGMGSPTTPKGMARASQAKGNAVPQWPRARGLGPVCSPLFLPASWSHPATPHPS